MRKPAQWAGFWGLAMALSGLAAVHAEAPQGASVSGIVRTATGEATGDAEVTLLDAGRLPVATVRSGADGRFHHLHPAPTALRIERQRHSADKNPYRDR